MTRRRALDPVGAIEEVERPLVGRLERKHGLPLPSIPGVVYVIHYGEPVTARSTSTDYPTGPIDHYVGWTQQRYPFRRVLAHHAATQHMSVSLHPGTLDTEDLIKSLGVCPMCDARLADSLTPERRRLAARERLDTIRAWAADTGQPFNGARIPANVASAYRETVSWTVGGNRRT